MDWSHNPICNRCYKKPEIVIIDNKSTDKTLDIVKYFEQLQVLNFLITHTPKLKVKTIQDYSPGKALNLGVKTRLINIY